MEGNFILSMFGFVHHDYGRIPKFYAQNLPSGSIIGEICTVLLHCVEGDSVVATMWDLGHCVTYED